MQQDSNYIYLYDLPKNETTSTSIAKAFEDKAGVQLTQIPQIQRNPTRPFYSAIVQIKDAEQFNKASEAMKYFQIGDKWCRALKYDKQLLGSNREKLKNNNVFVRKIPTDMTHADLQERFNAFGEIKSLKVSLNSDHSSRGYGFICFQDEQSAIQAVQDTTANESNVAMKFEPKTARSLNSIGNNVYVKNIPLAYSDEQVRQLFNPFGNIKSLVLRQTPDVKNFQYGFVCYEDESGQDKEYGPKCAQAAIDGLHGKLMDETEGMKLYVRSAMKAKDRELEKTRDTLKYKTSKKRCNLYVKNFPNTWSEDNLKTLFSRFGEIEKIKVNKPERSNAVYAFVCYMTPDAASQAKQTLHNQTVEGKQLIINHYEIKEIRELKRHEMIDKQDFERYTAQKTGGFHLNDLISHPNMTQILQQLIEIMQQNEVANMAQNQQRDYRGGHGRGGFQHHRGNRQMNQHQMQGGHQGPHQGMMQNNNRMPAPQNNNMPGAPMPGAPMPGAPMPGAGQMPGQPMPGQPMAGQPNHPQQQMTPEQRYMVAAQKILPSVRPENPYMKEQVGKIIYEFVCLMVPQEQAPKVTGMLIEIPPDQIKQYLTSFQALRQKVQEAQNLINQAAQQQQ